MGKDGPDYPESMSMHDLTGMSFREKRNFQPEKPRFPDALALILMTGNRISGLQPWRWDEF
jgi:hypothetical protein